MKYLKTYEYLDEPNYEKNDYIIFKDLYLLSWKKNYDVFYCGKIVVSVLTDIENTYHYEIEAICNYPSFHLDYFYLNNKFIERKATLKETEEFETQIVGRKSNL